MEIKAFPLYFHYKHPPSYVFYGHRHEEWEMNIILSGSMEITAGGNVERLFSGEAILIRPNDLHQNRVIGESTAEMLVLHFVPQSGECRRGVYRLSADALSVTALLVREAEREGIVDSEVNKTSRDAAKLLELLLSELARGERTDGEAATKDARGFRLAVEFMKANIDKALTTDEVARAAGACKTTLKKLFAYYTGMGCMRYFGEMKLERARAMLSCGQSCSAVADALGFSSLAYFSKKYKDFYGMPPSSVRQ